MDFPFLLSNMLNIKKRIFLYNFRLLKLAGIIILITLSTFPYFNLILSQQIIILFLLIILVSTLKLSHRFLFGIALVFISFSLVISLFSLNATAEKLGNYAYTLLFVGCLQSFMQYLNENRKNN